MEALRHWRTLTIDQKKAFLAAYLGWMLDAFDFFLLVFVIKDVAGEFHTSKTAVSYAITLTLACRPIGAFLFGLAADRWGRRVPLMIDVLLYSFLEVLTGFAPNLRTFLILRALFGVAMGVFVAVNLLIDILYSLIKAISFAIVVTLIHCYYGYNASGGPAGVGVASGRAIRTSIVSVVILNLFFSLIFWGAHNTVRIAG